MSSRYILPALAALLALSLAGCGGGSQTGSGGGPPPGANGFQALLGATFLHPRCTECHGFDTNNAVAQRHATRSEVCSDCHTVPTWRAPIDSFNFEGLSTFQICLGIKNKFAGDIPALRRHFAQSPLLAWGVNSGRVPFSSTPRQTAPPNSLPALLALADQWIANGAVCD